MAGTLVRRLTVIFTCALAMSCASSSLAQFSSSNVNPPGANHSLLLDAALGQQVGAAGASGGTQHATLWTGSATTTVDLTPPGYSRSTCNGTDGIHQVGHAVPPSGTPQGACLWTGTAASFVDLHPPGANLSDAMGVGGGQQVGNFRFTQTSSPRACLWTGTAASFVDLHPPGAQISLARRTDGTSQCGLVDAHGGLWAGSAATWLDLHPAGATTSSVTDFAPGQQVGIAVIGGQDHAAIWSGSPSTFLDVHPPTAVSSRLWGTSGTWQVGEWSQGSTARAAIWKGSASTFVDLHALIPGSFNTSSAGAVAESGGNIVVCGFAWNVPGPFLLKAVIWTLPSFVLSAMTSGGGTGDLTIGLQGIRPTATHVWLLVSGTPAPGGPGTGAFFGLFLPDPILFTLLATPPSPFSLLHFPVGANPYASGPLSFGPGSLSALAGQVWDTTAISYGPVDGISGIAPVVRLIW
jgi:hypothetical protein